MKKWRTATTLIAFTVLIGTFPSCHATVKLGPKLDASVMGMPSEPWPLIRQGPRGPETYLIPTQLDQIRHLPEPERSSTLSFIREHQANLSSLKSTMNGFFSRLQPGKLSRVPEYARDLNTVVMGVDPYDAHRENPIHIHEPVLKALPAYTRVIMLAPESALPRIRSRLKTLGLSDRVQTIASSKTSETAPGKGITRWMRDTMFVVRDDAGVTILTSLAYKDFEDVFRNDLGYLTRIGGQGRHVLRMPIFFSGGNMLVVEKAGRRLLLVGENELATNRQWFDEAFGFTPPANAVPDILKAAAGVDEVIVLPNSRNLFHLDTFIAPLGDGQVGVLSPVDPQRMSAADRDALLRAHTSLARNGFQVVAIPTSVQRMENFQSSANVVVFTDHRTGHRRALVPQFPEPSAGNSIQGLNDRVLAAYRNAGIDPIPVEDRFYPFEGSIHCALVPLQ